MATNDRIERFKAEAAELNLKTGNPDREKWLQIGGVVLMVAGVAVALVAYSASLGSSDQRDIQSYTILAIAMLAVSVVGAAVFLRYSMAKFLRFWLLRQLYEGQANVDEIVAAVRPASSPPGAVTAEPAPASLQQAR